MRIGIRLARTLHARWRALRPTERTRLAALAEDAKAQALEARGSGDPDAELNLKQANETLAAALIESAEQDPEVPEIEVRALRDDLRRELERLATADIKAAPGQSKPV